MRKCADVPIVLMILSVLACLGGNSAAVDLDSTKYITVDEVTTDMEAYCLTVYHGTKIERFGLKILSVVKNQRPGRDMILVIGTDERFAHTSAVHGCSGSPVFINGRLAGALAAGWDGSLDPLYLVRPIKDMLEVGSAGAPENLDSGPKNNDSMSLGYDFSRPLDLKAYYDWSIEEMGTHSDSFRMALPLATSLPQEVCDMFADPMKKMGLIPFAAGSEITSEDPQATGFKQGGTLAAVLCAGDISLAAVGTVTEIVGDQVYGFGHSFNGRGATNFPMASGRVHTVVSSRSSSFKFASPGPIEGTLLFDQAAAVRGTIGQVPKTIPLNMTVNRFDDPEQRTYHCQLAVDRSYTPMILQTVIVGAAQMQGGLPFQHTVRYKANIALKGAPPIMVDDISSGQSVAEMAMELYSTVGLLFTNPFQQIDVESIDLTMDITPEDMTASIWAAKLSETTVKPGDTITATAILKSYRAGEEPITIDLKIPDELPAGKYQAQILGPNEYSAFVTKMAPQLFRATDLPSLLKAFKNLFGYRRDRMHIVMAIPATGLVMRHQQLANLPPTKMLLMQDTKRLAPVQAYQDWIENTIELDKIIDGTAQVQIIVEK